MPAECASMLERLDSNNCWLGFRGECQVGKRCRWLEATKLCVEDCADRRVDSSSEASASTWVGSMWRLDSWPSAGDDAFEISTVRSSERYVEATVEHANGSGESTGSRVLDERMQMVVGGDGRLIKPAID